MPTLIITTNASQGLNITIRDLGIIITSGGGSETFTDRRNIIKASQSTYLRAFANDDIFNPSGSTLILNDGSGDIALADVDAFLDALPAEYNATNEGTAGVGVFVQKSAGNFEFKNINVGSAQLTLVDDTGNNEIDLDVDGDQLSSVGAFSGSSISATGGEITTTSTTDILMTGMQVTPGAGTYYAILTGSGLMNANNRSFFVSLYFNGVQDAASLRTSEALDILPFVAVGIGTVGDGQTIEARWRVNTGTGTVQETRSLILIKLTS